MRPSLLISKFGATSMNKAEWVTLSILPGVGGITFRRLLAHFGSVADILAASEAELRTVYGIGKKTAGAICHASPIATGSLLNTLSAEEIYPLTWNDAGFPPNLMAVSDAPPTLFIKGNLLPVDDLAVAIVGRRAASPDELHTAAQIAGQLARRGITVVSGLAIGVDTAAHHGALDAGSRTLAVLGSGIRSVHPVRNRSLAESLTNQGALLSELHPDAGPTPPQLVARDRIISGLSRLTLVVESGEAGGSMRTAEFARRQGRILAAVPGSPGTDMLIAGGAEPVIPDETDWDMFAERVKKIDIPPLSISVSPGQQSRLLENGSSYPENPSEE